MDPTSINGPTINRDLTLPRRFNLSDTRSNQRFRSPCSCRSRAPGQAFYIICGSIMTTRLLQLAFPALLCLSLKNGVLVESFSVVPFARRASFLQPSPLRTLSGEALNKNLPVHFSTSLSQVEEERVASAEDKEADDVDTPIVAETEGVTEGEGESQQKAAVQRERNTLFVGNLPFGKYKA